MPVDYSLNLSGHTIFARRWDPSEPNSGAAPLVLIHDSLGSVELWREFPELLAERTARAVFAYDRMGFGWSSARQQLPSADFIRQEAEEVLPALLRELAIEDFIAFGHSVGGAMALLTAGHLGERCKAAISEAAQAFVEDRTLEGIRRAQDNFRDPEQFARLTKRHGEKARWVLDAWTRSWLSPAFADWTLVPDLPRVKCPVLVLHGDQDEYGSVRMAETIAANVGGRAEMHVLAGCGHVPHRERPEETAAIVARFLKSAV
jgi:pimeloyl-ACP methyl ester carboxylesterase